LRPSFKHYFGLDDTRLVELSLLAIVHPDDSELLQSLLAQVKHSHNPHMSAMPVLVSLRFEYGFTGTSRTAAEYQYIPVELLMAMTSGSSIIVGISTLDTVQPQLLGETHDSLSNEIQDRPSLADAMSSEVASGMSRGEHILNGSDVLTSSQSAVDTFHSMEATSHRGGQVTRTHNDKMQL
jgi:hypothetical protein